MDENLRFEPGRKEPEVQTIQDFQIGILRAAEKCNGSDCRKPPSAGGSMCPSYRATLNEKILHGLEPMRYENI
jgi:hypothetical protein